MALITSALERERDLLQREVLKFAGVVDSSGLEQQLQMAQSELARLKQENRRVEEDALVRARLYQDKLDAEELKNQALQAQLEAARETMGSGIDELKVQVRQEKKEKKILLLAILNRWNRVFAWRLLELIKWNHCFGQNAENPKSI